MRTTTPRRLLARLPGSARATQVLALLVGVALAGTALLAADEALAWGATGSGGVTASSDGGHLLTATAGQALAATGASADLSVASGFLLLVRGAAPVEGAVTCTLLPEAARTAGAQWRLTTGPDTAWQDSGAVVAAVPLAGNPYTVTFRALVGWDSPANQSLNVIDHETTTVQGTYARRTYTVTFLAAPGGTLVGNTVQLVAHGADAMPVTAVPTYAFVFEQWSDGSATNPRTLTAVTAAQTLTAQFREALPVAPEGPFQAVVEPDYAAAGRGLWDLTGTYTTTVAGAPLRLHLVHDTEGRLNGTATYTVAKATVVTMPIRGSARGPDGTPSLLLSLHGADAAGSVSVHLTLALTLDAGTRQLTGTLIGTVTNAATTTPLSSHVALPIPAPMDGTWSVQFQLTPAGRTVTGTARLLLSNGVSHDVAARGRIAGQTVLLSLAAAPGDPAAKGIHIRATALPLEGGWATLQTLSARGYGQTLAW